MVVDFFKNKIYIGFSQRVGKKSIPTELQVDSMNNKLRNSLWDMVLTFYLDNTSGQMLNFTPNYSPIYMALWHDYFNEPLDMLPNRVSGANTFIRDRFFKYDWHEVYDFIDNLAKLSTPFGEKGNFIAKCNAEFEKHLSGYRFVGDIILPVTNKIEIQEIKKALTNSSKYKLKSVKAHLEKSMAKLADKPNPDFSNSIKESLCAVETLCQIIVGSKASLGQTLKEIDKKITIPESLKQGYMKLYGYGSSEGGIRHGGNSSQNLPNLEEAKYMLVSCSAFVNYLIVKSDKAGIKL